MTPLETAYRLILEFHVEAERYDRTLPGEWMVGEWVPKPGRPFSESLAYARELRREAVRGATAAHVSRLDWRAAEDAIKDLTYREKIDQLQALKEGRAFVSVTSDRTPSVR